MTIIYARTTLTIPDTSILLTQSHNIIVTMHVSSYFRKRIPSIIS